jgi:hypothetical protein
MWKYLLFLAPLIHHHQSLTNTVAHGTQMRRKILRLYEREYKNMIICIDFRGCLVLIASYWGCL